MADRIFKGRLITTGDIHEENRRAFPEASEDFRKPHQGDLEPFRMLADILYAVQESDPNEHPKGSGCCERADGLVKMVGDSLWISDGKDSWVKIDPDGGFEIGTSGV